MGIFSGSDIGNVSALLITTRVRADQIKSLGNWWRCHRERCSWNLPKCPSNHIRLERFTQPQWAVASIHHCPEFRTDCWLGHHSEIPRHKYHRKRNVHGSLSTCVTPVVSHPPGKNLQTFFASPRASWSTMADVELTRHDLS